jgi:heme-degrading monooxygenase HmoA
MIARMWHGVVPDTLADEYQDYIYATGLPGLESTPGNLGVMILRRAEEGRVHFLLISFWESYAAISEFAGADIERARYYPDDEKYLVELEPNVIHYEVIVPQEAILW